MSLEFYLSLSGIVLSLLGLFFHAQTAWRNRVSLRVFQDDTKGAWAFPFVMYQRYDCLFFGLRIENRANTDVSISDIVLYDEHQNTFRPEPYNVPDYHNQNGISLRERSDESRFWMLNLKTDNILNNLRIPAYGSISGFVVFLHGPVLSSPRQCFKVQVRTPTKTYKRKIIVTNPPETLVPYHEPKSEQLKQ